MAWPETMRKTLAAWPQGYFTVRKQVRDLLVADCTIA